MIGITVACTTEIITKVHKEQFVGTERFADRTTCRLRGNITGDAHEIVYLNLRVGSQIYVVKGYSW